jgi:hypothetical protein
MSRIKFLIVISIATAGTSAFAQEHGRIRRPPPTALEVDRMASDMAMNDSLLRKGDIVATDRGFFIFRGQGPDGITNDFAPVSSPLPLSKK